MSIRVYVGLGSNVGDPTANLREVLALFGHLRELADLRCSSFFESAPWGGADGGSYTNAVVEAHTTIGPRELLGLFGRLEREHGRDREREAGPGAPRTLDLDLLFFGVAVLEEPGLIVPHPRAHLRRFVLEPMCELSADFTHPKLQRTMRELLDGLDDPTPVRRLAG